MPNIFRDDFSKLEHEGWTKVAGLYDKSWANLTKQFIDPLLQAVGVRAGMKVLDVACGPGYVSQAIYLRNAIPAGVDFSASMIQLARESYPYIEFAEGDAQSLDFNDSVFDAVVMNFGMLHLSKPNLAMAEACRVLKNSGRFGFTVWEGPEKSPAAKIMFDSIMQFADHNVNMPEAPSSYLFADEELCRKILTENGFEKASVSFTNHFVEWVVPSAEYYFETELTAGVRTASFLKRQTPETLEKIRQAVTEKMKQFYDGRNYRLKFCGCIISSVKK